MKAFRVIVCGVVQGVGYRKFTKAKADEIGIFGSVKNLDDGSVEVFCKGERERMADFFAFLLDGPTKCSVDDIHIFKIEDIVAEDFVIDGI